MKAESPCIGCKNWRLCGLAPARMARCEKHKAWLNRREEYVKREGI